MKDFIDRVIESCEAIKRRRECKIEDIIIIRNKDDYKGYMEQLERMGYIWLDGIKPTKFTPFNEYDKYFKTIYILLDNEHRYIVYDSFKPKNSDILNIENVKWYVIDNGTLINLENKPNKIAFKDLKCEDFELCQDCPIKDTVLCKFTSYTKTFGEVFEEIKRSYVDCKNKYKKGDNNV